MVKGQWRQVILGWRVDQPVQLIRVIEGIEIITAADPDIINKDLRDGGFATSPFGHGLAGGAIKSHVNFGIVDIFGIEQSFGSAAKPAKGAGVNFNFSGHDISL